MVARRWSGALAVVSTISWSGCGGSTPGEAVRPKDPTFASAIGEPSSSGSGGGGGPCREVESSGEPLVVDWRPEQRGDLEVLMREAVAVVSYKCDSLKLLKECKVDGEYGFLGMTRKEQVVRLTNADEVKANLPLGGAALAASIGGEMQRGATLDVALVMIGKVKTTYGKVAADDLKGECAGATHFVRGATVGAFVMETGTKGEARTAAQILSAGASAASSSVKNVRNKDGEPAECTKAVPDSPKAPPQCQALVRLELKAIDPKRPEAKPDRPPEPEPKAEVAIAEPSCPKGMVMAEGKCTLPQSAPAYQCRKDDGKECTEQCAKGHAGSCFAAGFLHQQGRGGLARDPARARELYKKGCDGGEVKGCTQYGVSLFRGSGGPNDAAGAVKVFEKACADADPVACGFLGEAHLRGEGAAKDEAKALTFLSRGCEGGDDGSCGSAGKLLLAKGPSRDPRKGVDYLRRACDGGDSAACADAGAVYEEGRDVGKDPIRAKILYQRGCSRLHGTSCANLGRIELGQGGNADNAKRSFQSACMRNVGLGCAAMKVLYADARVVVPSVTERNEAQRGCSAGSMRDCGIQGLFELATGNKAAAHSHIERACMQRDPLACALKQKKP